jgi:CHAT domain-containing protein
MLRDASSKNGTMIVTPIGSKPVDGAIPVAPGDRFMVGSAVVGMHRVEDERGNLEQLRVQLHGGQLRHEFIGQGSVVARGSIAHNTGALEALQQEFARLVASIHAGTREASDAAFAEMGKRLSDALVPSPIQERIASGGERPLALILDPALLALPWEGLAVGEDPLSLTRPLSRQVVLENLVPIAPERAGGKPAITIIANPTGDLRAAQEEAEALLHLLVHEYGLHDVRFLAGKRARHGTVLEAFTFSDVVIYIGHAEHDPATPQASGWRLADGVLPAQAFIAATAAPRLVLASACESARETPRETGMLLAPDSAGFAAALMLAGAEQFVGTAWPIPVVSGAAFATVSFHGIVQGQPLGQALLAARRHLRNALGAPLHACAAYVHYGSPGWRLWR